MKTVSLDYTFSKPELQILKELAKGKHELSSIEDALSIKPSLLSYNLKKLQNKGLIKTTQQTFKKQVYFSDSKHAALLRDLLSLYDYIDWENILSGKAIEILFQILTKSRKTLDYIPKNTRWRHIKNLKARGIITQPNTINPRFNFLIQFLDEYQKFFTKGLIKTTHQTGPGSGCRQIGVDRGAGLAGIGVPGRVHPGEAGPFGGQALGPEDGLVGTRLLARATTVDAVVRIDVELAVARRVRADAVDRADRHAGLVHVVDAGFGDHVGHRRPPTGAAERSSGPRGAVAASGGAGPLRLRVTRAPGWQRRRRCGR